MIQAVRPRRQIVRDAIRRQIIAGKLASGTLLSELQLAKSFRTSRTPIREALMQLEQEGLVEIIPRRGAIVRIPTPPELVELYSVRKALEGLAVRMAANRMPTKRLAELKVEWESLQRNLSASTLDLVFSKCEELHLTIIEGAESEVISKVLGTIRGRIATARRVYLKPRGNPTFERLKVSCAEHIEIIKAMHARDADRSEQLIQEHLGRLLQEMLGTAAAKSRGTL